MKKIFIIVLGILCIALSQNSIVSADGFERSNEGVSGIELPGTGEETNDTPEALYIVIKVINWILGLAGTIAIIVFMIGGYKVLLSNGDETKAKGGYKIVKNAVIGLLIIGLTRATVRFIFRFVSKAAGSGDFTL